MRLAWMSGRRTFTSGSQSPPKVQIFLQMQNLDTFEAMTAAILQFLQHNAQYQAGVTISRNKKRKPDALTKKGKSLKGEGKSKTERQKASCFVCGRVGHVTKDCLFKDMNKVNTSKDCWFQNTNKVNTIKDCWFKDTNESGLPSNKYRKGKGNGKGLRPRQSRQ